MPLINTWVYTCEGDVAFKVLYWWAGHISGQYWSPHELPQQFPPSGLVTYKDLMWVSHKSRNGSFARIPENRLKDFIDGEGQRCSTNFAINTSETNKPLPKKVSARSLKARYLYCCTYGPEGADAHEEAKPSTAQSKRRKKKDHAEGKCGCKARFYVRSYWKIPDSVEIQMMEVWSLLMTKCFFDGGICVRPLC